MAKPWKMEIKTRFALGQEVRLKARREITGIIIGVVVFPDASFQWTVRYFNSDNESRSIDVGECELEADNDRPGSLGFNSKGDLDV